MIQQYQPRGASLETKIVKDSGTDEAFVNINIILYGGMLDAGWDFYF